MSVITRTVDRLYAVRIMSILTKDFQDWPAFKTGIIDASGNLLKTARSSEEKDSYTRLDAVLRPVKVALNKFPGGVTMLARAYLMKGFLYESDDKLRIVAHQAVMEAHRAYDYDDEDVDAFVIGTLTEALVGLNAGDEGFIAVFEEMVAGDSGGDPNKIAAGVTSGAVTFPGPSTKKKKVDKKKVE